jgi:hypothetical protein
MISTVFIGPKSLGAGAAALFTLPAVEDEDDIVGVGDGEFTAAFAESFDLAQFL